MVFYIYFHNDASNTRDLSLMIFDLILVPIMLIVNGVLSLLPTYTGVPAGMQSFFQLIGTTLSWVNIVFDMNTVRACATALFITLGAYLSLYLLTFVANLLPWLKPFSRTNPGVGTTMISRRSLGFGKSHFTTTILRRGYRK